MNKIVFIRTWCGLPAVHNFEKTAMHMFMALCMDTAVPKFAEACFDLSKTTPMLQAKSPCHVVPG